MRCDAERCGAVRCVCVCLCECERASASVRLYASQGTQSSSQMISPPPTWSHRALGLVNHARNIVRIHFLGISPLYIHNTLIANGHSDMLLDCTILKTNFVKFAIVSGKRYSESLAAGSLLPDWIGKLPSSSFIVSVIMLWFQYDLNLKKNQNCSLLLLVWFWFRLYSILEFGLGWFFVCIILSDNCL